MHSNKFLLSLLLICLSIYPIVNTASSSRDAHDALVGHENNLPLKAVIPESFPPFYFTDKEGLPYGMAIEVMNEIDHHAGYLTKYSIKKSWAEVFKSIKNGEAQIIPNLGITEERKKHYFFTTPYVETEVGVFTSIDSKFSNQKELIKSHIGVINKNIGKKVAGQLDIKKVTEFNSIQEAYSALTKNEIDAVIYPRIIALSDAESLGIGHQIYDTKITLLTIKRAIAVSKKHPEIYKRLNSAINIYLQTQSYKDTYTTWHESAPNSLSTKELILINCFILFISISFFVYIWKKKNFSTNESGGKNSVLWILSLILILITATTLVTGATLYILYETSFNEQRQRLIDSVKSRTKFIEAIARYDLNEHPKNKEGVLAYERTLSQIKSAHEKFRGFGKTGEYTMAKLADKEIVFILSQRHSNLISPERISVDEERAAPMRLALFGHSGTVIDKDYRGETVLSAYEPIKILKLGIVAKIDLAEIRKPFIDSALYILGIVILVSFFGALLFYRIMMPVIKQIKDTEQRFHQLFRNNQTIAFLINPKNARIIDANIAATTFYGYSITELSTYNLNILYPDSSSEMNMQLQQALNGENTLFVTQHRLQNGEIRDVEILTSPVEIEDEVVLYYVVTDITERTNKEHEYLQLQREIEQTRKMDALGQLTGGIAHDFNNMLGIIMGYTSLTREKLSEYHDNKMVEYLDHVLTASDRAKELISSMMLFSRTEVGATEVLNITPLVKEDMKMLRSIIPSSIEIETHIDNNLPSTLIEPVKLQQIIMNLCVNARDAMHDKGNLTVQLKMQTEMHQHCQICYDDINGDWLELSISDTGSGMTDDIVHHLFEPFFTTKEKNKGTGMGMSVVHGIVKSLGGHILIDTEINKGTTISILFKPVYQTTELDQKSDTSNTLKMHNITILIVDDEENLAKVVAEMLNTNDCQSEIYTSPLEALSAFQAEPNKFDLIISDQTMPELTGLEMIKRIRMTKPDIPAIIATGYSNSIDDRIANENDILLLEKPLMKVDLTTAINKVFK